MHFENMILQYFFTKTNQKFQKITFKRFALKDNQQRYNKLF